MSDHAAASEASPAEPTPMPSGDVGRNGEWITPDVSYVEPGRRFCAYCGRPIARRYWRESTLAGEFAFCQPAHAAMYAAAPARFPAEQPERTGG